MSSDVVYNTVSEVSGPLIVVEAVKGVGYLLFAAAGADRIRMAVDQPYLLPVNFHVHRRD